MLRVRSLSFLSPAVFGLILVLAPSSIAGLWHPDAESSTKSASQPSLINVAKNHSSAKAIVKPQPIKAISTQSESAKQAESDEQTASAPQIEKLQSELAAKKHQLQHVREQKRNLELQVETLTSAVNNDYLINRDAQKDIQKLNAALEQVKAPRTVESRLVTSIALLQENIDELKAPTMIDNATDF
ncbi:MAG TPA: hypothetical protein V6D17_06840 [Candidatus Obscuribacterales bacterium]